MVLTQTPTAQHNFGPDFSILMTCSARNCYFLQRALESIRVQFYRNIELIFVADRADLIDEAIVFGHETACKVETKLVPTSLNRMEKFRAGLDMGTGEWIVILDSDDMLTTDSLHVLRKALTMYPEEDYFTSGQVQIGIKNEFIRQLPCDPYELSVENLCSRFRQRHLWGIKRESLGGFASGLSHQYICEDYPFFAQAAMTSKIPLCIPYQLACYRRHSLQTTQREKDSIAEMMNSVSLSLTHFLDTRTSEGRTSELARLVQASRKSDELARAELLDIDF